jgi:type I restriction enzyme M protein
VRDIDALQRYWDVCPALREALFRPNRPGYVDLAVDKSAVRSTIQEHPESAAFIAGMNALFAVWRDRWAVRLQALEPGYHPKQVIAELSEDLLAHYRDRKLIDAYDIYQHLMDYWAETMQDDVYAIAADGWKAETYRIIEKDKRGKERDKGWACDLIPKALIVARYFVAEQAEIDRLAAELEKFSAALAELEEEHSGEGSAFSELDRINKTNVSARLKEIQDDGDSVEEASVLRQWLALSREENEVKSRIVDAEVDLDEKAYNRYPKLTEAEIKALV